MKTKLFVDKITRAQAIIIGFWVINFIVILFIWQYTSIDILINGGSSGILTAAGRLFGLLAVFFALTQFLLMGRVPWLERPFGLDHLASYHRKNGNYAFILIILHPIFITIGYALASDSNVVKQYIDLVLNYPDVWLASIAEILFIIVAGTSIYIVRTKLKFESWYYVHLLVYIAIVVAFFHQVMIGGSFTDQALARAYWVVLYAFVGVNLLIWRFGLPVLNMYRYDFRIDRIVRETPTTVSVYIKGKNLLHLNAIAGQFIFLRILDKNYWRQEHPFSLSAIVSDDQLRITVREVGDYTQTLKDIRAGKRVIISGPFGRFTKDVSKTFKTLYIAGGVGITPIRSMIEESSNERTPSILIYANRTPDDVVFDKEIMGFETTFLSAYRIFADVPSTYKGSGRVGRVDVNMLLELVPNLMNYDIYLCGPPPMMAAIIDGLKTINFDESQLHYEIFSLQK
ncbi:MAG: ferredoxin reductase family protein [Candidatus Saccharimonadales bacterium]